MALIDSMVRSGMYVGIIRTFAASASARIPAVALQKKSKERLTQAVERCMALITASVFLEALPTKIFEAYSFNKIITWGPFYLIPLAILGLNYPTLTEKTLYLVQAFSITYSIAAVMFAPSILTVAGAILGIHSALDPNGRLFKEIQGRCGNIGTLALQAFGALALLFTIKKAILSISVKHVLFAGLTIGCLAYAHAKKSAPLEKKIPAGYVDAHKRLKNTYRRELPIAFKQVINDHLQNMASALGREMTPEEQEYIKDLIKLKWSALILEEKEEFELIACVKDICGKPTLEIPESKSLREDWIFARFTFSATYSLKKYLDPFSTRSSLSMAEHIQDFFLALGNGNDMEILLSKVHVEATSMAFASIKSGGHKWGHKSLTEYERDHATDLAHAAFNVVTF